MAGMGRWVTPERVGCIAIVATQGDKSVCAVILHQNPHATLTATVLRARRVLYPADTLLTVGELERCEHCAAGPRDITMRPVTVVDVDTN